MRLAGLVTRVGWSFQSLKRALAMGVLVALVAAHADAAPALWAVTSPTATIYLFGTMHILEPAESWRTPALDAAYAKATTVWFETDMSAMTDPKKAASLVLQYGVDAEHPLSTKLDPEHLGELKAVMEHDHIPFDRIDRLRPWAAALVVIAAPMVADGFAPKSGADVQLTTSADADHKTLRTFETNDEQMRFFSDMSPPAELQFLENTIDGSTHPKHETKGVEMAWVSGDMDHLGPLIAGGLKKQYPALYDVLLRRRNLAWSEVLTKELAGSQTELVNVGALHMVGDDGLPALLKGKGFTVTRLQ